MIDIRGLSFLDLVADAHQAGLHDLCAQAASMDQSLAHRLSAELLKMGTGFAKPDAAKDRLADPELPANKMIQRYAAGGEVAPRLYIVKLDVIISP